MLQWLYMYVISVCFKCFICFFIRILQVFLFGCCIYFTHMLQEFLSGCLHIFWNVFSSVLSVFASVSYACFKCFICLQTHVANVSPGCFKSRSSVVHVAMWLTFHIRLLQLLGRCAYVWEVEGWSIARLKTREAEWEAREATQTVPTWCGHAAVTPRCYASISIANHTHDTSSHSWSHVN
jgi:hypothetical protein